MTDTFPKSIVSPPLITVPAEYPFLDKFIEIASGCSGFDPCVRSVFTTRNLLLDFHQRDGSHLPICQFQTSQHFIRQSVSPQRYNKMGTALLKVVQKPESGTPLSF